MMGKVNNKLYPDFLLSEILITSKLLNAGVDDGIVINSVQGVGDANLDPLVFSYDIL